MSIENSAGSATAVSLDGDNGNVHIFDLATGNVILGLVPMASPPAMGVFVGAKGDGVGIPGHITVRGPDGSERVSIEGDGGRVSIHDQDHERLVLGPGANFHVHAYDSHGTQQVAVGVFVDQDGGGHITVARNGSARIAIGADTDRGGTLQVQDHNEKSVIGLLGDAANRATAGFVRRPLFDGSGSIETTPAAPPAIPYPFEADQTNATDNQIIRLRDGSLLASKNGYIWTDLAPRPHWFDKVDVAFDGRSGSTSSPRARNAVYLFHSDDHGVTWTLRSTIDAAVDVGGEFGWPQDVSKDGVTKLAVGGFDRTELYQDPWTGHVYVAGHGDSGPITLDSEAHEAHPSVIFRSTDDARSWQARL